MYLKAWEDRVFGGWRNFVAFLVYLIGLLRLTLCFAYGSNISLSCLKNLGPASGPLAEAEGLMTLNTGRLSGAQMVDISNSHCKSVTYFNTAHQVLHHSSCHPAWYTRNMMSD